MVIKNTSSSLTKTYLGNCLDVLKTLPDDSVDSIVTDPPYGLSFMSKKWDYNVPSKEIWIECLRVLKHGGHLLAFGGTRTYHRLVVEIEDAGFEIRDQIQWLYGSGFPKSLNISKAIDKAAGAKREVVDVVASRSPTSQATNWGNKGLDNWHQEKKGTQEMEITKPATPEAEQWDGWGTALKPANEPICLARKPIKEKTIAANVIEHGTGALNINDCRIKTDEVLVAGGSLRTNSGDERMGQALGMFQDGTPNTFKQNHLGRYPANVILDEEVGVMLDEQSDVGASRFFYCAKASKSERNKGLEAFENKKSQLNSGGIGRKISVEKRLKEGEENAPTMKNIHPTVKPVKLMRYLCRLITPPNGTVLDPFMGSGTTGIGAILEGFDFIGIEMEEEYLKIAEARIEAWKISDR